MREPRGLLERDAPLIEAAVVGTETGLSVFASGPRPSNDPPQTDFVLTGGRRMRRSGGCTTLLLRAIANLDQVKLPFPTEVPPPGRHPFPGKEETISDAVLQQLFPFRLKRVQFGLGFQNASLNRGNHALPHRRPNTIRDVVHALGRNVLMNGQVQHVPPEERRSARNSSPGARIAGPAYSMA